MGCCGWLEHLVTCTCIRPLELIMQCAGQAVFGARMAHACAR